MGFGLSTDRISLKQGVGDELRRPSGIEITKS